MFIGAILLFGNGFSLNLAPVEFRQVVGLYIATLFVVWQVINFFFFRTGPNAPILVGGSLIVIGGLIVTFWNAAASYRKHPLWLDSANRIPKASCP